MKGKKFCSYSSSVSDDIDAVSASSRSFSWTPAANMKRRAKFNLPPLVSSSGAASVATVANRPCKNSRRGVSFSSSHSAVVITNPYKFVRCFPIAVNDWPPRPSACGSMLLIACATIVALNGFRLDTTCLRVIDAGLSLKVSSHFL